MGQQAYAQMEAGDRSNQVHHLPQHHQEGARQGDSDTARASYADLGLTNDTTYYYAVTATKGAQESAAGEISGTPEAPPGAPEGLEVAAWDSKLTLKWKPVTGATKYTIHHLPQQHQEGARQGDSDTARAELRRSGSYQRYDLLLRGDGYKGRTRERSW